MEKLENAGTDAEGDGKLSTLDQEYLKHLIKVNDIFYDQIGTADQKAAFIFTFMIAFLISSTEGKQVFSLARYQSGEPIAIILSGFMAVAVLVSVIAAIMVVLPRHVKTSTSLYWAGWPANRTGLADAQKGRNEAYLFDQYLANADTLAIIARTKYRYVWIAFRGLMVSIVGYVLLLIWQVGATSSLVGR
ncbi:MAG: DUF5706 domain-containing protein [Rhizobiaceae bacterium]|nr:DUF5706 domain-containing protein [Rhizobiaceae bacterium]